MDPLASRSIRQICRLTANCYGLPLNCSLTSSAAFLLGGTLGNYDVYALTSVSPVLAGIFFVPLFLIFSVFGFTVLTAVVLRKYDFCAQSVEQNIIQHKLEEQVHQSSTTLVLLTSVSPIRYSIEPPPVSSSEGEIVNWNAASLQMCVSA